MLQVPDHRCVRTLYVISNENINGQHTTRCPDAYWRIRPNSPPSSFCHHLHPCDDSRHTNLFSSPSCARTASRPSSERYSEEPSFLCCYLFGCSSHLAHPCPISCTPLHPQRIQWLRCCVLLWCSILGRNQHGSHLYSPDVTVSTGLEVELCTDTENLILILVKPLHF